MTLLSYIHNDACDYCRSMMLIGNMDTKAAQHTIEVCTSLDLYMERSDTLHNIWDYACTKTLVEGLEILYCPTDDLFTASLLSTDGFQEDLEKELEKNLATLYELRYDNDNDEWIDTNTDDVADFHVDVEEVELA